MHDYGANMDIYFWVIFGCGLFYTAAIMVALARSNARNVYKCQQTDGDYYE